MRDKDASEHPLFLNRLAAFTGDSLPIWRENRPVYTTEKTWASLMVFEVVPDYRPNKQPIHKVFSVAP